MKQHRKEILVGIIVAIIIVVFLSPLASSNPDGLEKVAEDKAFLHRADGKEMIQSLMPDYVFPGLENETLAGILAGVIGIALSVGFMFILGKVVRTKSN